MTPQTMAVIGTGLMGHGIALTLARAGHASRVTDPMADARAARHDRFWASLSLMGVGEDEIATALGRIRVCETLADAVTEASVVFEAAPEKMALKQSIFAEVEATAPRDCILASTTSVMPITGIMSGLQHSDRALGTHWWNPPHMIPLVEVIRTEWTAAPVVDTMVGLLGGAGKPRDPERHAGLCPGPDDQGRP